MLNTDPLGVMVVMRPNTGKTGQEFGTQELLGRYRLVKRLKDATEDWTGEGGSEDEKKFVSLWK